MKRPTLFIFKHIVFGAALIMAAVLFSVILSGFMYGPLKSNIAVDKPFVDLEAIINRVTWLHKKNEHQKAIDLLLQVVRDQKEDFLLRTLLVQSFDLFLEEEIRMGQKAVRENPRDMGYYGRVAGALELLGDNFHAMEILLNGIYYDPGEASLWMKIARLELAAGREMEALDVFKEVIRLDKKNGDAYNNAAYLLAKTGNGNEGDLLMAQKFAEIARKLNPKNAEYIDTLAEISFKNGNLPMAKSLMEEAIRLAPENDAYKKQLIKFSPKIPPKAQ